MTIFYNCTGTRRKELVTAISEITGAKAEYQFMPTQAYQIDYFTVDKDSNLSFDDRADSEEIELLIIPTWLCCGESKFADHRVAGGAV